MAQENIETVSSTDSVVFKTVSINDVNIPLFKLSPLPDVKFKSIMTISSQDELEKLQAKKSCIAPNTKIVFSPGEYYLAKPIKIENCSDLIFEGGPNVSFYGKGLAVQPQLLIFGCNTNDNCEWTPGLDWKPIYPKFTGYSVFHIVNSSNIHFSEMQIYDSWPNAIWIQDSQSIKIEKSTFIGGTNAIFANGLKTQKIQISQSFWEQDPTGEVWSHLPWQHVHHGKFNYFNGAFFQSRDIRGQVLINKNLVLNAFNGVRMKVSPSLLSDNSNDLNKYVTIADNQFVKVSDNVIEPEVYLDHWQVLANTFVDYHAAFSFSGVAGVSFIAKDNKLILNEKPRQHVSDMEKKWMPPNDRDLHNGGTIFKLKGVGIIKGFVVAYNTLSVDYTNDHYPSMILNKGEFPEETMFVENVNSYGTFVW